MHELLAHCQSYVSHDGGLTLSLFLAGLVGGMAHCSGMCSPFVLAQLSSSEKSADMPVMTKLRKAALLPYHAGRMTTYVWLGAVGTLFSAQLIGSVLPGWIVPLMLAFAGLLFLLSVFPVTKPLKVVAIAGAMQHYGAWLGRLSRPFMVAGSVWKSYVLGILLGFLPCGLVLAALMAVMATGDPLMAMFGMAAFAAGTMPALIAIALGGQCIQSRWPTFWGRARTGAMIVSSVSLFVMAGTWNL